MKSCRLSVIVCGFVSQFVEYALPCGYIWQPVGDLEDDAPESDFVQSTDRLIGRLESLASSDGDIPVVGIYDAVHTLPQLLPWMSSRFSVQIVGKSERDIYIADCYEKDEKVLRIWEMHHLCATDADMAADLGVPNYLPRREVTGKWCGFSDMPTTRMTYMKATATVIYSWLQKLIGDNPSLQQKDLGCRVLTRAGLQRRRAHVELTDDKDTRGRRLETAQRIMSAAEKPGHFATYQLHEACTSGALSFSSLKYLQKSLQHVISLDVDSMHHAFICGRKVPTGFYPASQRMLSAALQSVMSADPDGILRHYEKPFDVAFHMKMHIENVRLNEKFATDMVCPVTEAVFKKHLSTSGAAADNATFCRENVHNVHHPRAKNPTFSGGRLIACDELEIYFNEVGFYAFCLAYDFSDVRPLYGDLTSHFEKPPDYTTMQSVTARTEKQEAKKAHIDAGLYNRKIKAGYNSIYGFHMMDVCKPTYKLTDGRVVLDEDTVVADEESYRKTPVKGIQAYGARIVDSSRLHLMLALRLLYRTFPHESLQVVSGDTDSLHIATDGIDAAEILQTLQPLGDAVQSAMDICLARLNVDTSVMSGVGSFTYRGTFSHWCEMQPKTRIAVNDGKIYLTAAGIPETSMLSDALQAAYDAGGFDFVVDKLCGYNLMLDADMSGCLDITYPKPFERICDVIVDDAGGIYYVEEFAAARIKKTVYNLCDDFKRSTAEKQALNDAQSRPRQLRCENGRFVLEFTDDIDDIERWVF